MQRSTNSTAEARVQEYISASSEPRNDSFVSQACTEWKPIKTLKTLCLEILAKNVDRIDNIHNYPRDLIIGFLYKASVNSLYWFERRNSRVKKETDALWERHFKADFPNSRIHLTEQTTHGWRHCYFHEKRVAKEKALRFHEKLKASKEASKIKRQVKMDYLPSNHPLNLSHSQRLKFEAQALKANPAFEKIRRQAVQQSQRSQNVGRPCPPPPGIPIGICQPIRVSNTSPSSSSSMSPPASFSVNARNNSWSMSPPPQAFRPTTIINHASEEQERTLSTGNTRKAEGFSLQKAKRIKNCKDISKN